MKRRREEEIVLNALANRGIELTEEIKLAVKVGLRQIRQEKHAEAAERKKRRTCQRNRFETNTNK